MVVKFGEFTLHQSARQLLRGNLPVHLPQKAFELLVMLIEHHPAAVSKGAIHQRLWPESFVSDGSVAVLIADIRLALGDDAHAPVFIRTIHRFGYAFMALTENLDTPAERDRTTATSWLARGDQRAPISAGDNVVGRGAGATLRVGLDPAAAIQGDPSGISRHHAMIAVTRGIPMLHDLSSKNGTYVDGVRVTAPVRLENGSQIRLGSFAVQFCQFDDVSVTRSLDHRDVADGARAPRT